jgi:hypothetical protein
MKAFYYAINCCIKDQRCHAVNSFTYFSDKKIYSNSKEQKDVPGK